MPNVKMWLMVAVVCSLVFLLNIDYTAVNLALLPIAQDIHTDLSNLQWLLSGYVLVWGALVVPAGRLADLYGKRRILLIGICIFLAGSLLTGIGSSLEVLIAGRLLQGIGAAVFSPASYGIIFSNAPADKQGLAMGFVAGVAGIGLAVGPSLAGAILEFFSWRWIFYINIPIGLAVISSVFVLIPKDGQAGDVQKSDHVGAGLLALGLGASIYGLNQIEVWGLKSFYLWLTFVVGFAGLAAFVMRNRTSKTPVIPLSFLQNKPLMATIYAIFFGAYNFSMVLVLVGLYLTTVLGYTSSETGVVFLAMTLALGALAPIGGKLADKMDMRIGIGGGFVLSIIALLLIGFADEKTGLTYLLVTLFLAGVGMGLCFPAMNTAMMRSVESQDVNTASGLFTMAMMVGNTIGVIVSTSLLVVFGRSYLKGIIATDGYSVTPEQFHKLSEMIGITTQSAAESTHVVPAALLDHVPLAFMNGLFWNMIIGAVLAFLGAWVVQSRLKLKT